MPDTFQIEIVTPEKMVVKDEARSPDPRQERGISASFQAMRPYHRTRR